MAAPQTRGPASAMWLHVMLARKASSTSSRPTGRDASWINVRSSGSQTERVSDFLPKHSPLHSPYEERKSDCSRSGSRTQGIRGFENGSWCTPARRKHGRRHFRKRVPIDGRSLSHDVPNPAHRAAHRADGGTCRGPCMGMTAAGSHSLRRDRETHEGRPRVHDGRHPRQRPYGATPPQTAVRRGV
jgi:hypothetical protein